MNPQPREYPARPLVGIAVTLLRDDAVLLIRRGHAPAAGQWSLPGGAQRLGETAEAAARRELIEETGLRVGELRLVTYVDSLHRDEAGRIQFQYTILEFCGRYEGGQPRAGGDAAEIAWAGFDRLDAFGLWQEARRVVAAARETLGLL